MYFFSFNQSWNKALFFALPSLNNINLCATTSESRKLIGYLNQLTSKILIQD